MTSGIKFSWIYRSMIENRMRNQQNALTPSNQETEDENVQENPSNGVPQKNQNLHNSPRRVYALKEKKIYYFSPRALSKNLLNETAMLTIYHTLLKNNNVVTNSSYVGFGCALQHVYKKDTSCESALPEIESQDSDNKCRYILSHGDCPTSYSYVTERGVASFGDSDQNSTKTQAPFMQRLLTVLRQYYIAPYLVSEDHLNDLESISKAPESSCGPMITSTESKIDVPEAENGSSDSNIDLRCRQKFAMEDIDDETFELLSLLEDETDIKEQPRDLLFKRESPEEREPDESHLLEEPLDGDIHRNESSNARHLVCKTSNEILYPGYFLGKDLSLADEGFLTDPVFRDAFRDRQAEEGSTLETCGRRKYGLSFVAFVKAMLHTEEWKAMWKFVKS